MFRVEMNYGDFSIFKDTKKEDEVVFMFNEVFCNDKDAKEIKIYEKIKDFYTLVARKNKNTIGF